MATHFAEELSGAELSGFVSAETVGVLAVAAIEPHGPHLPLSTDCDIARGHLQRLGDFVPAETDVLILPLQTIGASLRHANEVGAFAHRAELLLESWMDMAHAFAHAGGKRLVFVSSNEGNDAILDIIVQRVRAELAILAVGANWLRFGQPQNLFEPREWLPGVEGGAIETALMLHYWPEAVRAERLADFASRAEGWEPQMKELSAHGPNRLGWLMHDLAPDGALGNAAEASSETGAVLAGHILVGFAELIADAASFDLRRLGSGK